MQLAVSMMMVMFFWGFLYLGAEIYDINCRLDGGVLHDEGRLLGMRKNMHCIGGRTLEKLKTQQ